MKKFLCAALLATTTVLMVGCGSKGYFGSHDIRNSDFRDSMEEVKSAETGEFKMETEGMSLMYDIEFMDHDAMIRYNFANDMLYTAEIAVAVGDDESIEDVFEDIKSEMVKAYGEGDTDTDSSYMVEKGDVDVWVHTSATSVVIDISVTKDEFDKILGN